VRWASTLCAQPTLAASLEEAIEGINAQLGGEPPDLVAVFVDPQRLGQYYLVSETLKQSFPHATVLGCVAGGVVGAGLEVEDSPALSMTAAVMPAVSITPFHLEPAEVEVFEDSPELWHDRLGLESGDDPDLNFLLIPEPFTCDAKALLASLDVAFPSSAKVGGLASGARQPGSSILFLDRQIHTEGVVGLALRGDLTMDTIVAQGCKPIGEPLFITWAEDNRIYQLEGRKASQVLAELFETLPPADQETARYSLFMGIAMEGGRPAYEHGDFLIRNLIGLDPESGVIAIGEGLKNGQVVQFHLRDAATSALDLRTMLTKYRASLSGGTPQGALMFSCLGRGKHLYGEAHHDSRVIMDHLGDLPLGGFFCNGEIGPIGGRSYLHGYTSAIALFRPKSAH
jgi:small ligand-binding sensory domain FIST